MKRLELTTFGGVNIKKDGQLIGALSAHKSQALLIYLAVTGQKQSRQVLAGLLWGDMLEAKARRNLRVALTRIRDPLEDYLIIKRRSLALDPDSNFWLDAAEFESCLAAPNQTADQLQRAAELYQGPFLDDFILRDAPLFEEWLQPLQERYRQMAMEAIYRLAEFHTNQRQYNQAIIYAQRLLKLEPWMEEAHRQLMLLFALSGQRTPALSQYDLCSEMLWEELGVEPSAETTALYQQIRDGEILPEPEPVTLVPAVSPPVKPVQLPATTEHFVGRSAIIKSIVTELCAGESHTIHALTGMGGIGKSTLAVEIGRAVKDEFSDGILWANAATSEPMAVMESWAAAYGYDFTRIADLESLAAAFRGILAEKRVLIVLDDVTSLARIRPLLPGRNKCRVLLTTRNHDIAQALNARLWPVQELSPENGRLLFSSILGDVRVAAEPAAADTICSLLQNLPLAVEITAQRLKSRPHRLLKDMAERLRDETQRLSLLKISDREVRASFTVSWEALDTERKRVFALLGLFNGRAFTLDAMSHIAEIDPFPMEDLLYDLYSLSLVRLQDSQRYYQHPLLADFAREKLGEDLASGNGRFSQYYLNFAQTNQNNFNTLRAEWDNLKAALNVTYDCHWWPAVIDYVQAIKDYCFKQGRYSRARQAYRMAYNAAHALEDIRNMAESLLWWGKAAAEQHNHDEARQQLEESRRLFESLDDSAGYAGCQSQLARIALEQSRYDDALVLLKESRAIRQEIKDFTGVAETYHLEARTAYFQTDFSLAEEAAAKAIELQEQYNDTQGLIHSLSLSASIALQHGQLEQAEQFTERAIHLCDQIDNQSDKSMLIAVLAETNRKRENLDDAEKFANESLEMLKLIGDLGSQAQLTYQLSNILLDQERFEEALAIAVECLALSRQVKYTVMEGIANFQLGRIYIPNQENQKAQEHLQEALKIGRQLNHPSLINMSQELLLNVTADQ